MKTELQWHSTPHVGTTIMKLALVGSVLLACVYGVLALFGSALKMFE
jgi:hypothetical protein